MSKRSDLEITIIEMLEDGHVCADIAKTLNIPLIWVEDLMQDYYYDHEEYHEANTR